MQVEKTVFISYRRTNAMTARAVYQDLTAHGYDCFLDYNSIDSDYIHNQKIHHAQNSLEPYLERIDDEDAAG